MNTKKIIKNLKGIEMPKSFPTQTELDALPIKKIRTIDDGKMVQKEAFDTDKLERESVGNIIINSLAHYKVKDKKEGFYCNMIAQTIIGSETGEIALKRPLEDFLIEVLDEMTLRVEKTKDGIDLEKGIYNGWAIAQVKQEMGINE